MYLLQQENDLAHTVQVRVIKYIPLLLSKQVSKQLDWIQRTDLNQCICVPTGGGDRGTGKEVAEKCRNGGERDYDGFIRPYKLVANGYLQEIHPYSR